MWHRRKTLTFSMLQYHTFMDTKGRIPDAIPTHFFKTKKKKWIWNLGSQGRNCGLKLYPLRTYIRVFKFDKSVWGAQNMGTIRKGLGDREGNPIIEELLSTEQHNGWSWHTQQNLLWGNNTNGPLWDDYNCVLLCFHLIH